MEDKCKKESIINVLKEYIDDYLKEKAIIDKEKDTLSIMNDIINMIQTPVDIALNYAGVSALISLIYDNVTANTINHYLYESRIAYINKKLPEDQKLPYYHRFDKYRQKIIIDYKEKQDRLNDSYKGFEIKTALMKEAKSDLEAIKSLGRIPQSNLIKFYDLLSKKGYSEKEIIMSLENLVLASTINVDGVNHTQTNIQELLNFGFPTYQLKFDRIKEYKYQYNGFIDTISGFLKKGEIEELFKALKEFNLSNCSLEKYDFVYQSVINNLMNEFFELQSEVTFKNYCDQELRLLYIKVYSELRNLLIGVDKLYQKNRERFLDDIDEIQDDLLENVSNESPNTLVFLPSSQNITCLEKDLKNLPKEYYYKVKNLLEHLQDNCLTKNEIERFTTIDKKLSKYGELRDDQVRILFYPLGNGIYIIIGAMQKQVNNASDRVKTIAHRFNIGSMTKEYLDYLLSIKDEDSLRIMSYIKEEGRKSTR